MTKWLALILPLLAGCADLPRDPDGTLERVRAYKSFRVGLIARGGEDRRGLEEQRRLLEDIAAETGARPTIEEGPAEPLLARLEAGELDLVVGPFDRSSPWHQRVTITDPIADFGAHRVAAAMPNGENAWIMLVERQAKRLP